MYSVETCGVCIHEKICAYESPCCNCKTLRSACKESYFLRIDGKSAGEIEEESRKKEQENFIMNTRKVVIMIGSFLYMTVFGFGLGMLFGLFGAL